MPNLYANLKQPRSVTQYTLMRGVSDFGNLAQWNLYESGYSYLVIVGIPRFLEELKKQGYSDLIDNYLRILEYEFRGLDGLENITADTSELTNGISTLNIITKVNQQSASNFSMRYFEKSGSVITRVHELFLRGIKDPRTQAKTYGGLIGAEGGFRPEEAGYENETFSLLYINTDNTMRLIEKAVYIIGAQPTTAELNIYNSEKGDIGFKEISAEFTGFPITGPGVDEQAKKVLDWINSPDNPNKVVLQSDNFAYKGVDNIATNSGVGSK